MLCPSCKLKIDTAYNGGLCFDCYRRQKIAGNKVSGRGEGDGSSRIESSVK